MCRQWHVLGSVLVLLSVTAVVLLVPAAVALLGVERHRHLAASEDSTRRVRLVLGATIVGLSALATTAVLGAEVLAASVVAVVLAGSVLVWAPLSNVWAVRGVVVWALLVSGSAGLMGWLLHTMATSSLSAAEWIAAGAAWLLLLIGLVPVQRLVRRGIAGRAGLVAGAAERHTPLLRPAVSLAALLAASGVVVAVTSSGSTSDGEDGGPQADGLTGTAGTSYVPTPASPSPVVSPTVATSARPTGTAAGVTTAASWSDGGDVVEVAVAGTSPWRAEQSTWPPDGSLSPFDGGKPVAGGSASTTPSQAPAPGGSPTSGSAPGPGQPTGRPTQAPSSAPDDPSTPGDHGPTPSTTPKPTPRPTLKSKPTPAPVTSSPTVVLTRLLGYEKERPNRPAGAPSPGHGRPGHARKPTLPVPGPPTWVPPASVPPTLPPVALPEQTRTPGYEKDKPNRPSGAPSPGHGRPSPY